LSFWGELRSNWGEQEPLPTISDMKTTIHAEERGAEATQTIPSQFTRTAAGAAALGAVFTLPVAVDAAVVYGGPETATLLVNQRHASNKTIFATAQASASLDLNGDALPDFGIGVRQRRVPFQDEADVFGHAFIEAASGNGVVGVGSGSEGGGGSIFRNGSDWIGETFAATGPGAQVQFRQDYSTQNNPGIDDTSGLPDDGTGVVGVRFNIPGTTSNAPTTSHWGWVRLAVENGGPGFPYEITAIEWAYETEPDTAIHVPGDLTEVPEANPGLVLLAAGGTGLVAWRLRRRKEAKQAA
jgi:hypothetical protein